MLCIAFITITALACSDSFLEQYPETGLNEGNFYKNQIDFVGLANGLYVPMREYHKSDFWILAEVPSDNGTYQFNAVDAAATAWRNVDEHRFRNGVGGTGGFWTLSYNGIARTNKLLEEIERDIVWDDLAVKQRIKGEAHFMRGLYYFNLVRIFGGVPLVLQTITYEDAKNYKRETVANVYHAIIGDLNEAVSYFSSAQNVHEPGRASLGAAQALLGKVYLTLHRYAEAEATLKSVIDGGQYGLLTNYEDLFDPANKNHLESIFSMQYSEANRSLSHRLIFHFAPSTSGGQVTQRPNININNSWSGWNLPTTDLINAFEPGDVRKDASVAIWTGADYDGVVKDLPYVNKYKAPTSATDDRTGDNIYVLRYSDVLLMYAEVLNEQGKTGEAIPYVAQVRRRAGLDDSLSGLSQHQLTDLIAKERQVEFCFENHRWFDLLRTGKALEILEAHGQRELAEKPYLNRDGYQLEENYLIYPIPTEQVLINGLEQNPGY